MLECLSFALHVARHKLFLLRTDGFLRRLMTTFTALYRRWGPALPACPPPSHVTFTTKGVRAHRNAPLDHGPFSKMGTSAPNAVIPCRGSNSTMEARAPNAAPINYDTGACNLHAPPRHASRSKKIAAATRRPHTRAGSSPLPPDHKVAVGLRCGKANLYKPRYFTKFYPVSSSDSSGRSFLFPIKKEPTSLASISSKRANRNEPPRARNLFPLARAPLSKTPTGSTGPAPSFSTLTHVHQAMSAPVAQDRDPTLHNGPVVTPRPPARSAGQYSRADTDESRLSSSSNSSDPPVPSGPVRTVSCDFMTKSDKAMTRPPVGLDSRRAPEVKRSQTGTLQAQSAGDWCPQTGTLQANMPNTASDGLRRRL